MHKLGETANRWQLWRSCNFTRLFWALRDLNPRLRGVFRGKAQRGAPLSPVRRSTNFAGCSAGSLRRSASKPCWPERACWGGNPNVIFAVRPWAASFACSFFPSSRGCVPRTLMMDLVFFGRGSLGTFRHELGHILGLQHENIRAPDWWCRKGEGGGYWGVTAYDSSSVMHYECGATNDQWNLVITPLDAAGIRKLYGPPPPRPW